MSQISSVERSKGRAHRAAALLAFLLIISGATGAALFGSVSVTRAAGLDNWQGLWSGTCRSIRPGAAVQQFNTSLQIRPLTADRSRYSWILTYGSVGGRPGQVRSYEIVAVDAAKGHYLIDEKNGLKLDAHKVANQIFLPFTFGRVLITAKYIRMNQGIVMELPSFPVQPIRRTCLQSDPATCAQSFRLTSLQLCFLRRSG